MHMHSLTGCPGYFSEMEHLWIWIWICSLKSSGDARSWSFFNRITTWSLTFLEEIFRGLKKNPKFYKEVWKSWICENGCVADGQLSKGKDIIWYQSNYGPYNGTRICVQEWSWPNFRSGLWSGSNSSISQKHQIQTPNLVKFTNFVDWYL